MIFDLSGERSSINRFHSCSKFQMLETSSHSQQSYFRIFPQKVCKNVFSDRLKNINYSKFVTDIWSNMALRVVNNNALSLKSSASKVMMRHTFTFSVHRNILKHISCQSGLQTFFSYLKDFFLPKRFFLRFPPPPPSSLHTKYFLSPKYLML